MKIPLMLSEGLYPSTAIPATKFAAHTVVTTAITMVRARALIIGYLSAQEP
jgi:hypothetical protein